MENKLKIDLLQILLDAGEIGASNVKVVMLFIAKWQVSAFTAVLECNLITEQRLADVIAESLKLQRVYSLEKKLIAEDAFTCIRYEDAVAWEAFPVGLIKLGDDEKFRVIVSDPTNERILNEIIGVTKNQVNLCVGERKFLRRIINDFYPIRDQLPNVAYYKKS